MATDRYMPMSLEKEILKLYIVAKQQKLSLSFVMLFVDWAFVLILVVFFKRADILRFWKIIQCSVINFVFLLFWKFPVSDKIHSFDYSLKFHWITDKNMMEKCGAAASFLRMCGCCHMIYVLALRIIQFQKEPGNAVFIV